MNPQDTVKEIIALYVQHGHEAYGKQLSMLQHMTQSAELAEAEGYDNEVVLAAFLHDIGHFLGAPPISTGTSKHDQLGADYLRKKGFSTRITVLVGEHVEAKRYLTLVDPLYYQELSEASKKTLIQQGGRMSAEEAIAFEASPYFELNLKLRRWDEASKDATKTVSSLEKYESLILKHLNAQLVPQA